MSTLRGDEGGLSTFREDERGVPTLGRTGCVCQC